MEVSNRLSEIRKSRGISIYKLAKLSDISDNHIHAIEKGERQPSINVLNKLLKPMNVSLSEFFEDENEDAICVNDLEKKLINLIRKLPEEKAKAIINIAELISK